MGRLLSDNVMVPTVTLSGLDWAGEGGAQTASARTTAKVDVTRARMFPPFISGFKASADVRLTDGMIAVNVDRDMSSVTCVVQRFLIPRNIVIDLLASKNPSHEINRISLKKGWHRSCDAAPG